jgi:hypothetical protein
MLTTHWAQRDINLARGLDFWRNSADNLGPVWARVTFLDYSEFVYNIQVSCQIHVSSSPFKFETVKIPHTCNVV